MSDVIKIVSTLQGITKAMREVGAWIILYAERGHSFGIMNEKAVGEANVLAGNIDVLRKVLKNHSIGDCGPSVEKAFFVTVRSLQRIVDGPKLFGDGLAMWMDDDAACECAKMLGDAADELEVAGEIASREWITTAQACTLTGKAPSQISKLCSDGTIRSFGTHKGRRIDANSLARWFTDARDKKVSDGESTEAVQRAMDQHVTNGPS